MYAFFSTIFLLTFSKIRLFYVLHIFLLSINCKKTYSNNPLLRYHCTQAGSVTRTLPIRPFLSPNHTFNYSASPNSLRPLLLWQLPRRLLSTLIHAYSRSTIASLSTFLNLIALSSTPPPTSVTLKLLLTY